MIEPCPICERDAQCKASSNWWYKVSRRDARHSISTWTCFDSHSKAIDAWNALVCKIKRRAIEAQVDSDVLMSAKQMKERIAELKRERDEARAALAKAEQEKWALAKEAFFARGSYYVDRTGSTRRFNEFDDFRAYIEKGGDS